MHLVWRTKPQYTPVAVEHADGGAGLSTFLLQQGQQRRVVLTIAHESGAELAWGKVAELSIGSVFFVWLFCCVLFVCVFLVVL
jgi:hypothetical protein